MTEQIKTSHFHSLLRKGAPQTFQNKNATNCQTLEVASPSQIRQNRITSHGEAQVAYTHFDPNTMKLPHYLDELNQVAEKAFGENAKGAIDKVLYAKWSPKLKRSVNMARLENGTYEEIVAHLERELEFNALEESDDLAVTTMASTSNNTRNLLSNGIKTVNDAQCTYCKASAHFWKKCSKLKKETGRKKLQKTPTSNISRKPNLQEDQPTSQSHQINYLVVGIRVAVSTFERLLTPLQC